MAVLPYSPWIMINKVASAVSWPVALSAAIVYLRATHRIDVNLADLLVALGAAVGIPLGNNALKQDRDGYDAKVRASE